MSNLGRAYSSLLDVGPDTILSSPSSPRAHPSCGRSILQFGFATYSGEPLPGFVGKIEWAFGWLNYVQEKGHRQLKLSSLAPCNGMSRLGTYRLLDHDPVL